MKAGRVYEVLMDGKPIGLIGSTQMDLRDRRYNYVRRFGQSVELRLIREIPGFYDEDYIFHLRAAEAIEIYRRKAYKEQGGLNQRSPIVEMVKPFSFEERKRGGIAGGLVTGRNNLRNGHWAKVQKIGAPLGGRVTAKSNRESGRWAEVQKIGAPIGSKIGICKRWNINRGKPCTCGRHTI